jgi:hypothetical protein
MPNTDEFQIHPDFIYRGDRGDNGKNDGKNEDKDDERRNKRPNRFVVRNKDEREEEEGLNESSSSKPRSSNPRYRFFRQNHFTAGDIEQFLTFWDPSILVEDGIDSMDSSTALSSSSGITPTDIFGTFCYLFHEMKKGIFLKFFQNELRNFLPFSKADYKNSWSSSFRWNKQRFPELDDLFRFASERSGHAFRNNRVHKSREEWYANNGLIRYEHPISEGDSGVNMIRDMFVCLSKERSIPDVDCFLNKRDFPLISKDPSLHPYDAMYGKSTTFPRLTKHQNPTVTVLSMTTTNAHRDIPIPTWEDWCRASYQTEKKLFPKPYREYPDPMDKEHRVSWEDKIPTVVFRGASTGLSADAYRNPRIRYSMLSLYSDKNSVEPRYLDVGITQWNLRPRRENVEEVFDTFSEEVLDKVPLVSPLTLVEQSRYKYILHLPGHSFAYRLSYELSSGSVVLMYPCQYRIWYSHLLKPMVHYVPLDPEEDIFEKIQWCRENDVVMRRIADNARVFYETVLSRKGILDFLQNTMEDIFVRVQGGRPVYYPFQGKSLEDVKCRLQREYLETLFVENDQRERGDLETWMERMKETVGGTRTRDEQEETRKRLWRETRRFPMSWWKKNILENSVMIRHNRNTEIRNFSVGDARFCLKMRSSISPVDKDLVHEAFILDNMTGKNKEMKHLFPIFYTLGSFPVVDAVVDPKDDDGSSGSKTTNYISILVTEFIPGRTLEQWLKSPWSSSITLVQSTFDVLSNIALGLDWTQNENGFMHMDMYPWNIIITPLVSESSVDSSSEDKIPVWWNLQHTLTSTVRTVHDGTGKYRVHPVLSNHRPPASVFGPRSVTTRRIGNEEPTTTVTRYGYRHVEEKNRRYTWKVKFIDLGRSHIIHKGYPISNITPFVMNRMHDMISITWNVLYIILKTHHLDPMSMEMVRHIVRFFDPILPPHLRNGSFRIYDFIQYLHAHKRFSTMLQDTYENPMHFHRTPLDFFQHLQSCFSTFRLLSSPSSPPKTSLSAAASNDGRVMDYLRQKKGGKINVIPISLFHWSEDDIHDNILLQQDNQLFLHNFSSSLSSPVSSSISSSISSSVSTAFIPIKPSDLWFYSFFNNSST